MSLNSPFDLLIFGPTRTRKRFVAKGLVFMTPRCKQIPYKNLSMYHPLPPIFLGKFPRDSGSCEPISSIPCYSKTDVQPRTSPDRLNSPRASSSNIPCPVSSTPNNPSTGIMTFRFYSTTFVTPYIVAYLGNAKASRPI